MSKAIHSLADRFNLEKSPVFLTGPQAIVRLALMQSEADRRAGLNTAGYVTGYRGSPVGTVDTQFVAARGLLEPRNIRFQPGLNEDLAATALWGTQQAEVRGEGRFDGVFGIWYGKGPGVDRSGDVFRHVNMAGTSPHGGVLAIAGDDHSGESSTVVHASDVALSDAMMPVLSPAGVQEIIDFGLLGFALSRFSGLWVGLKCMHDTVESAAVVEASPGRVVPVIPKDHVLPEGGLSIRVNDDRVPQEERLHRHKIPAVLAFARANHINRVVYDGGAKARIGIVAAGKSYLDVRQALEDLGIDEAQASRLGVRLLKIGLVWPIEPSIIKSFARGLETIIVVEEKRSFIETQVKDVLYGEKQRPLIIGKTDERGSGLFPGYGVLDPVSIAMAVAARLNDRETSACAKALHAALPATRNQPELAQRVPYFCAGCPHNTSTKVPEGARAYAGIGCHWLAQFVPDRRTEGFTHMGGEGANWVGEAPFSKRRHVFQNIGDGTYNHSGLMAIRHAVNSGVNITYKILYNDAVAMTGGQKNDGGLTVPQIAQQMRAIGVERIAVVSDEPDKYPPSAGFPVHVSFHHRDELEAVQGELQERDGASVLIYDQTCAAEKRRRRRRGEYPDPKKRVFINDLVCEGCGDCGIQSNCVAIQPVETEFGRKRQIDQSSCNKDFSCLKGFCPSFVTVEGGELRKPERTSVGNVPFPLLPEPELPSLDRPWGILAAGIGGTGVVTIGHVLGQAAFIEGKGAALIDMVGISQKNGAVVTHLKIGADPSVIAAVRVARGSADLILGCDLVTSSSERILACASVERTRAVLNVHESMPARFVHERDFALPSDQLARRVQEAVSKGHCHAVDASGLAVALLGDAMTANLFMLGFAYQKGLVPVGAAAIEEAVKLNGVSVKTNLEAFMWGRRAAHELGAVHAVLSRRDAPKAETLEDVVGRRVRFLTDYQNAAYADNYRSFVADIRTRAGDDLAMAVARNLFKLMAYKDEYEVARLFTEGGFLREVESRFAGDFKLAFHLAPPVGGNSKKRTFGPWMLTVMKALAKLKVLRGTAFDVFGRSAERRKERQMIDDYRVMMLAAVAQLTPDSLQDVLSLARLPEQIRGFGHVKAESIAVAEEQRDTLLRGLEKRVLPSSAAE